MTDDERIAAAHTAMQAALVTMKAAFDLLTDSLYEEERVETVDPAPKIASEDPAVCEHPTEQIFLAGGQRLCNSCGLNLDA